jgi:hypothetical protein
MRIREVQKHTDPTDPDQDADTDPEHCFPQSTYIRKNSSRYGSVARYRYRYLQYNMKLALHGTTFHP